MVWGRGEGGGERGGRWKKNRKRWLGGRERAEEEGGRIRWRGGGEYNPYHCKCVYLELGYIGYPNLLGHARIVLGVAHQHMVICQQHK